MIRVACGGTNPGSLSAYYQAFIPIAIFTLKEEIKFTLEWLMLFYLYNLQIQF